MTPDEIRLECLRIAAAIGGGDVLTDAKAFAEFVSPYASPARPPDTEGS